MIEFVEDTHTYLCDGVIIPSVSELIRFKFPNAYKGVPDYILQKKATYGTEIHRRIEEFVRGEIEIEDIEDANERDAVEQFEILRKTWAFYVKDMEQIVCYDNRFCGTYDIRTQDDLLIDIKTTSKLHEDWLRWQLGLYYLAAGIKKDFGFVMWFPKGKMAEVRQINVASHEECIELIDEYEKAKFNSTEGEEMPVL